MLRWTDVTAPARRLDTVRTERHAMEDLTLALITLTSFVLLFVVAIFADRAGADVDEATTTDPVLVPVEDTTSAANVTMTSRLDADVA